MNLPEVTLGEIRENLPEFAESPLIARVANGKIQDYFHYHESNNQGLTGSILLQSVLFDCIERGPPYLPKPGLEMKKPSGVSTLGFLVSWQ